MAISVQHIRNATSVITMLDKKILVDPMLSSVGELPPVPFTRTLRRNPITPLPVPLDFFEDMDAILLTHRHFDHFDLTAKRVLKKKIPIFCQPEDLKYIQSEGFHNVYPIVDTYSWCGINFKRIKGQHAKGIVSKLLGPVSGFILSASNMGSLYIVGDCIYTEKIEQVFKQFQPEIAILNTPKAQLVLGTIITMTPQDILKVLQISPASKIVAVHLDAISHCTLKRRDLALFLEENHVLDIVSIPQDGEIITF
jgi:L-ascorbate metabolism protein UlaG (beta-lactamase superfamily)